MVCEGGIQGVIERHGSRKKCVESHRASSSSSNRGCKAAGPSVRASRNVDARAYVSIGGEFCVDADVEGKYQWEGCVVFRF